MILMLILLSVLKHFMILCCCLQFCQSFCLSIDSLLNINGPDHHLLSATMETDREAILSQLAEPLQFIHNLDLSHVFEHYYR